MKQEYKLHVQLERNDIREEEKLAFIKNNPGINFEIPPMIFSEGRQSRVSALEIIKDNAATRVVWKRCGVKKQLTIKEAKSLCLRLLPYREILKKYGWDVPNIFYSEAISIKDENVIFSYEELVNAADAERMFKDPETARFEKLAVIQKIIYTLTNEAHQNLEQKIYFGQSFSQLPYGIDLKLANLILDTNGNLYFVDFFGPKELDENYNWKIYNPKLDYLPQENLALVCATREGCILRMLKLALLHIQNIEEIAIYINHFKEIIIYSSLPKKEKEFILNELEKDFPLLKRVYEEQKV
ncbi:MAG: hypothetical protein UU13_C0003G0025 [Candidatus Nomurabacteria bacterium GW2011_GWB1_40_7]|uniref:Protein kinase domain-containing protein n=1 Tax=Candidatus Nomurabacteria bacterium GW2011_GWB1_40_7 TaxID=1618744 RepID=A0A0G0T738_9BACT|nr:MAG: hypothetical protein UU13_C0003G0025 [Candidatus Nomurabacteria bacterium GW2011_GWB1_40_7]